MTDNTIAGSEFQGDGVPPNKFPDATVKTVWLHATKDDKFDPRIATLETALVKQLSVFGVPAAKAWGKTPKLDSGSTISALATTGSKIEEVSNGIKTRAEQVKSVYDTYAGRDTTSGVVGKLVTNNKAMFEALSTLTTKQLPELKTNVESVGKAGSEAFTYLHGAFRETREGFQSSIYSQGKDDKWSPDEKKNPDPVAAYNAAANRASEVGAKVPEAANKITVGSWTVPSNRAGGNPVGDPAKKETPTKPTDNKGTDPNKGGKPTDNKGTDPNKGGKPTDNKGTDPNKGGKPTDNKDQNPQQQTPQQQTPQQQTPTPQQQTPQASTPQMPQVPSTGGLEQALNKGIAAATQAAANHKPDDEKKPDDKHKPDEKKPDQQHGAVVGGNGPLRPGDPVRPNQLGADGKPLDKDGDGKMDKDAVAPTKENMVGPDGKPKLVEYTVKGVDEDGKPTELKVKGGDPRVMEAVADMAEMKGQPGQHLPVLDALRKAGIDLDNPGEKVDDPTKAKPGDILIGNGEGVYLGAGKVMCEDGVIRSVGEVLAFGEGQGFFRPELPDLPSGDGPPAPESAKVDGPPNAGPPAGEAPQQVAPVNVPPAAPAGESPQGGASPAPNPPASPAPDTTPPSGQVPAGATPPDQSTAGAAPAAPQGDVTPPPAPAAAPAAPQGQDVEGVPGMDQQAPQGQALPRNDPFSGRVAGKG